MTEEQASQLKPGTCLRVAEGKDAVASLAGHVVWFVSFRRSGIFPVYCKMVTGESYPFALNELEIVE